MQVKSSDTLFYNMGTHQLFPAHVLAPVEFVQEREWNLNAVPEIPLEIDPSSNLTRFLSESLSNSYYSAAAATTNSIGTAADGLPR
jgi:hypothetical protein